MRDHGLNRPERRRRRLRTLSRLPLLLERLDPENRPMWRGWFYALERSVGKTRREAWRSSRDDVALSRLLRVVVEMNVEKYSDDVIGEAQRITREAA